MTNGEDVMLTIIRGLPGSGKSTYARSHFPGILLVEADMFAMVLGAYRFSIDRLKKCHDAAQHVVFIALDCGAIWPTMNLRMGLRY